MKFFVALLLAMNVPQSRHRKPRHPGRHALVEGRGQVRVAVLQAAYERPATWMPEEWLTTRKRNRTS